MICLARKRYENENWPWAEWWRGDPWIALIVSYLSHTYLLLHLGKPACVRKKILKIGNQSKKIQESKQADLVGSFQDEKTVRWGALEWSVKKWIANHFFTDHSKAPHLSVFSSCGKCIWPGGLHSAYRSNGFVCFFVLTGEKTVGGAAHLSKKPRGFCNAQKVMLEIRRKGTPASNLCQVIFNY